MAPYAGGGVDRLRLLVSALAEEERLLSWRPEKLILRVDRTDLSKNIVRGFLAYERMLEDHHELHGEVQFWAYLQPSRQDIDDYRAYLGSVLSVAARINRKFSRGGWTPIRVEVDDVMARALAGYRQFDVLLVNPIYDGMNLVAKEGVICNRREGVLVLSENAGLIRGAGRLRAHRQPVRHRRDRGGPLPRADHGRAPEAGPGRPHPRDGARRRHQPLDRAPAPGPARPDRLGRAAG